MKNSGMYRGPDMQGGRSRREVLTAMGVFPLAYLVGSEALAAEPAPPKPAGTGGLIVREGWILRADDLEKLGIG